eukprot:NODE_1182_length_1055_cov_246.797217_g905_i0.p1 GENE.NODE_1182_length_1055_cov_246.797217_g905_i0~~NODE_1182_length_1055_cov_246.797217_g905_i0.p1  ORF type:complete len:283 (+),score=51.39 NODE_1182_length_1055_cov_246.797217_g905_i0:81-929(+)
MDKIQKILRQQKPPGGAASITMIAGLGVAASLFDAFFVVKGGHKAIKFNVFTGLSETIYDAGTHIKIPFLEWPISYDCRTRPSEISSSSGSRDLQLVDLTLRVLYKPGNNLPALHRTLGENYAQRLLPSVGNEVMKAVLAQYNVSELLTRRSEVSAEMNKHLIDRCRTFNVDVVDVAIRELTFGKEYSHAVEAKQIAQQHADRARFLVEQSLQEKKSKVVLAEGEAEAAKLIGEAVKKNPGFILLRQMECAKDIAEIVAKGKNRMVLESDALLLNLPKPENP